MITKYNKMHSTVCFVCVCALEHTDPYVIMSLDNSLKLHRNVNSKVLVETGLDVAAFR